MLRTAYRAGIIPVALVLALALSACAARPPLGPGVVPGTTEQEEPAAAQGCSTEMMASFDYNGPNLEVDLSVVENAFGADLPDAACVVLNPGDTAGTTYFHIFWPGADQNFANSVGNTLVAAGVGAYGDPIEYRGNGSDMTLWAYPAGDDLHWSEYFDGSPQLVVGEGNIPDTGDFG